VIKTILSIFRSPVKYHCYILLLVSLFCFGMFNFYFVLFCFVLFCFVLFCFVLFCFVLFCFVLFCFVLFCLLFCFVLLLVCWKDTLTNLTRRWVQARVGINTSTLQFSRNTALSIITPSALNNTIVAVCTFIVATFILVNVLADS
jgi:hypothetical protein